MVAPIDTSALVDLMGVPIDTRGLEFALGIVFSVPVRWFWVCLQV